MNSPQQLVKKCQEWATHSVNRKIFTAAVTVGVLSVLAKLVTAFREIVVAAKFGVGSEIDTFLIAYLLPSFVISVVAGSFGPALIPTFVQVRESQGHEDAQRLFSSAMLWSIGILVAASVVLAAGIDYLIPAIAFSFDENKRALVRVLFFALLPLVVINGVATLWNSVLNAREKFVVGAFAPAITPGAVIICLIVFQDTMRIYALVAGMLSGALLECMVLAVALKKHRFRLLPRWYGATPELRKVKSQYVPMIAGTFLMTGTGLVDQAMAAMLEPGSVAALSYGNKLITFTLGFFILSVGTVVLPYFAGMVARMDWRGIQHTLRTYTTLLLYASIPMTAIIVYWSYDITVILFERGAFVAGDSHVVSRVQAMAALQIPFHVVGILYVQLISSLRANHVLMIGAAISLPLNIVLNYLFMQVMGVAGIALSTSVVYAVSCFFLMIMYYRILKAQKYA